MVSAAGLAWSVEERGQNSKNVRTLGDQPKTLHCRGTLFHPAASGHQSPAADQRLQSFKPTWMLSRRTFLWRLAPPLPRPLPPLPRPDMMLAGVGVVEKREESRE